MENAPRKTTVFKAKCWFSDVKQRKSESHNPKVVGSNPAPATTEKARNFGTFPVLCVLFLYSKKCVSNTFLTLTAKK